MMSILAYYKNKLKIVCGLLDSISCITNKYSDGYVSDSCIDTCSCIVPDMYILIILILSGSDLLMPITIYTYQPPSAAQVHFLHAIPPRNSLRQLVIIATD